MQVLLNILTLTTLEQFSTENRGIGFGITLSCGMLGGVSLPFFETLSTDLLIIVMLVLITAALSVFFLRETKQELHLRNLYCNIFPEAG